MDVFDLLSNKLENFLNIRPCAKAQGPVFHEQDEIGLLLLAARKSDGSRVFVSRWHDLFSVGAFQRSMAKSGFSEPDCHAILVVLSRFGHLLDIDNRRRINKDYFVFFYLVQLIRLKNSRIDADGRIRNHMLRFLLFELGIDDEVYRRFGIRDDRMAMTTDALGSMDFLHVIDMVYDALDAAGRKEHALLATLKDYQASVVRLLAQPDGVDHRLAINDRNGGFMYPDILLETYARNDKRIFMALADTVDPLQSTENLFVSNMILMNYSFHVLKERPREILELKRRIGDDRRFGKLLEALIKRRMEIDRASFEGIDVGHDLSAIEDDRASFYNILYSR